MSGWVALNVEPEDDNASEVDDTKEIQLEEAFKLYQNALKFHSQGPAFYQEAADAYDQLFKSEVFKYPEAVSEFDHDQLDDALPTPLAPTDASIVPVVATGSAESANSLPQLIYLACKARAQFLVDQSCFERGEEPSANQGSIARHHLSAFSKSLFDSAAALERDDTDLDLWKRAARVSEVLSTSRTVRFCLESVLAGDEEGEDAIDLSGLDEAFARDELQLVLESIQDDLTESRISKVHSRAILADILKSSNDPYPLLPKQKIFGNGHEDKRVDNMILDTIYVKCVSATFEGLTHALLGTLGTYRNGGEAGMINGSLQIHLPEPVDGMEVELATSMKETRMLENKKIESSAPIIHVEEEDVDSPASFHSVASEVIQASETPKDSTANQSAEEPDTTAQNKNEALVEASTLRETAPLPSRKRSSTAAGNEEPEARTKSKRIRARESLAGPPLPDEEVQQDPSFLYRDQLATIEAADDLFFKLTNPLLEKIGIPDLGDIERLRQLLDEPEPASSETDPATEDASLQPLRDLRSALRNWDEKTYHAFTIGYGSRDRIEGSTGLSLFLKHSKVSLDEDKVPTLVENAQQLQHFAKMVKENNSSTMEVVSLWLTELLTGLPSGSIAPYLMGLWSSDLKDGVARLIKEHHEDIVKHFAQGFMQRDYLTTAMESRSASTSDNMAIEFAQAMFELHLDIFADINSPTSTAAQRDRMLQLARLRSWAQMGADLVQEINMGVDNPPDFFKSISLRFLWASIMFAKISGEADKGHILLCLRDLQEVFQTFNMKEIVLPNNATMPVLSETALEQEISKVETLEFFMGVFDIDNSDPYSVIMKLEPILEYSRENETEAQSAVPSASEREQIENFRAFLDAGDASLALFLWKRLQNAYTTLSYNTKVVSCLLRSLETIVKEIFDPKSLKLEKYERQQLLLRWIRDADDIIAKVVTKILDDASAFESIDESHLISSLSATISLLRLVHSFVLLDDSLRVGSATPPQLKNATAYKHFEKSRDKLREMYVRLHILLYCMVKETTVQKPEVFANAADEQVAFLRAVHAVLGERQYCKQCNKMFVRLMKTELFSSKSDDDLSLDIAQVMYDLYQIKLSTGQGDSDHGCAGEALDRDKRTAHDLVPIIMDYVKRLNIKDLLKSELKNTIDKIQNALGQAKSSTALTFNRKTISAYLKSLVNPQRLFQSLKGIGELEVKSVSGDFEKVASKGWYLLLGNMTLAKYRSVKRVNPTPTDELDNALSYLRQDLEHNPTRTWESWYRLAQVYDAKIEDCLIWNSNKLNEGRSDLAALERNAINAYTMAVALAMRAPEEETFSTKMLNDLFSEFATRLYSSSRPPLSMEAFNTDKSVRHLSDYVSQVMSVEPLVRPIPDYMVWTLAAHLIRRSLSGDSKPWFRYYMLGKCLWKMFRSNERPKSQRPVEIDEVIDAFSEAVDRVPKKERSSDPILEPHFKLVSIVHKLQDANLISLKTAVEYLQVTSYATGIRMSVDEQGKQDWEAYILAIIEKLQKADKSGWHHRITARAAHVIWDNERTVAAALGAKHKFADAIFTKNMTMQVWKPENERPGRHYVYTGRYLQFFIQILNVLRDRSNLEQVVRKIRRKTTDFINHTKVWEDAVTVYIDLLRAIGDVPRGRDRGLFDSITFDEFTRQSEKLEKWAHEPDTTSKYLDLLQDAIEMKKLNNSLSKSSVIDDLIGDAYACMYEGFVSQLPPEEQAPPTNTTLPQGTFINMNTETVPTGDDNRDRMRLNNLLSSQTDGPVGSDVVAKPTGLGIVTNISSQNIGTPPPDLLRVPAPSKPGRTKTITRREVQKKAEALISKPPPIKTPTLSKKPLSVNIPSIRKSESHDQTENDETNALDKSNMASIASSRRGSLSRRNSVTSLGADADDDGDDGDNEEEAEEDEEDEEDENADNEANDSFAEQDRGPRKRLFEGILRAAMKDDDDDDEDEDEDNGEEEEEAGGEDEENDDDAGSGDDKMSDVQDDDDQDGKGPEIPDSQEQRDSKTTRKGVSAMDID